MPASFSLHAAGSNARGQLATGTRHDALRFTPCVFFRCQPGALPPDVAAIDHIACGANHTLALLRMRDRTTHIWAAGDGSRGQLGPSYLADIEHAGEDASAVFRPLRLDLRALGVLDDPALDQCTVRFVAAGWETSYLVFSRPARDDVLLAMGADDFGNLATGRPRGTKQPFHIVRLRDAIPHQHTDRLLSILALTAGPHHTLVHVRLGLQDGPHSTHILGWGTARHGQLGPIPGRPPTFISSPRLISSHPDRIAQIALGNQHTVILDASGSLLAFGSNRRAQLEGLSTLRAVARVGCTWNGTYALQRTGALLATGSNSHSQLGRGPAAPERQAALGPVHFPFELPPGRIVQIACGSEHVLCVTEGRAADAEREVWGWGWNEHGNLGTGGTEDVGVPAKIWPPLGENEASSGSVVDVWAGCGTSWILLQR